MMGMKFVEVRINLNKEDNADRVFDMVKVVTKGMMRGFVFIEDTDYVGVIVDANSKIDKVGNLFDEFRKTFFLNDVSLVAILKDYRELRIIW